MRIKLWFQNEKLSLLTFVVGLIVGMSATSYAQQRYDRIVLGRSGAVSGVITFLPPDGTGWYHIDNPGNQRLSISGGEFPGQYRYMTISHPGKVTIHGDLEVTGNLRARSRSLGATSAAPIPPLRGQGAKSDDASPHDVQNLQRQIDELYSGLQRVIERVNRIP